MIATQQNEVPVQTGRSRILENEKSRVAAHLNEVLVQTGRSTIWKSDVVTECKDLKETENEKSTLMTRKKTRRNQKRGKHTQSAMQTIHEGSEIVDDFA